MAGGIFKLSQPKVRPGVYVNVVNGNQPSVSDAESGVATIPFVGYDFGPRGEWIKVEADSPEGHQAEFGRSVYDSNNEFMLMLQLMLQRVPTVYVYIIDGGTQASKDITMEDGGGTMTVTAKYKGSLGNTIKLVSVANPTKGYDVSVYLNGSEVELFEELETVEDLIEAGSQYVDIVGEGNLEAFASATLEGGDDEVTGNSGVSEYLDKLEKIRFNCMAFPIEDESLKAAALTKIRYIRENIGWKCQAVIPDFAADYEGVINLVNGFVFDNVTLTAAQACAWLAGAVAGADKTESLTYSVVDGATEVAGELTNEAAIAATKEGQTFFSVDEEGAVILENDINSKVTFADDDPKDIYKNRPLRVYDSFANDLLIEFRPGKYNNTEEGWEIVTGIGKTMLQSYEDDGAIINVDLDSDFIVDTGMSTGDSMYITAGIQPIDSADKYYFTVNAL